MAADETLGIRGKADLHMHTCHDGWGDGNDTVQQIFDHVEQNTDLTLIALTDHDSTEGAREGMRLHSAGTFRFDYLPGVEVTTTSGHLLCYFSDDMFDVPSLRSLAWTVRFVHERGGFCLLAHPVYPPWLRRRVSDPNSQTVLSVDGIETVNAGLSRGAQEKLDLIGAGLQGRAPIVGNSDAHHKGAIGSAYTLFPGDDRLAYMKALRSRETAPVRGAPFEMPRQARSFTRKRSMTRPGWVRNVYREVAGHPPRPGQSGLSTGGGKPHIPRK